LLTDQDWLLLLRETGELAFVAATSDSHPVLATSASTESKTWNHPVLVGDLLLLRNEQEMAGLRLPLKSN
jgi:outer membrane protein assembly factor BamB